MDTIITTRCYEVVKMCHLIQLEIFHWVQVELFEVMKCCISVVPSLSTGVQLWCKLCF